MRQPVENAEIMAGGPLRNTEAEPSGVRLMAFLALGGFRTIRLPAMPVVSPKRNRGFPFRGLSFSRRHGIYCGRRAAGLLPETHTADC